MAQPTNIWIDGELKPFKDAKVHVLTHSLHYGTAVFEGIRAYKLTNNKTAIFRVEEHFERFINSMRVFGYTSNFSIRELIDASKKCISANGFGECYIRPIAFVGEEHLGLKLPKDVKVHIAIAVWDWGKYLGAEGIEKGVKAMISTFRRMDISSSLPWAKTSGPYIISVLARREASLRNCDEAILLDPNGFVAEGSGENIFIVKKGNLLTPFKYNILPGITRETVIELSRDLGLSVEETLITRNELYLADEVFFCGTAAEVTPIREIDGITIGSGRVGPITKKISDHFFSCVRGENEKFSHWLTII